MLLATVVQLGAMVGGVGQALNMAFPSVSPALVRWLGADSAAGSWLAMHPENPWGMLTAFAAVALLLSGGYLMLERFTTVLVAGVTAVTTLCVLLLPASGHPIPLDEVTEGLKGHVPADPKALAAAFAAFGITGVGAAELFSYPYWCLEKGYARAVGRNTPDQSWVDRAKGWMRVMQLDAWASMIVFTLATVSFYFLGATVLHPNPALRPKGPKVIEVLSQMYEPAFGSWTKLVFLVGAWAVLFKTLYIAWRGMPG
jgi:Mn2+/Fe2+ NRAMP family transporter